MEPKRFDDIVVQSYKHNGKLHRIWAHATIIDILKDGFVIANYRTKVIEANGRFWYTKEPSVSWFFKSRWFNVIGIIRSTGIFYYCNIASPCLLDAEGLKYIDYDLDVKVMSDYQHVVLDRKEFEKHLRQMKYPAKLRRILESELEMLRDMIRAKRGPFETGKVEAYYKLYLAEVYNDTKKT